MKNQNLIPLNSFISKAGICSRREAVDLIKNGNVLVNDRQVYEPGYKVKFSDVVKYKDEIVKPIENIYLLLNKPKGYQTGTENEQSRKSVTQLIRNIVSQKLHAVSKLDRDTSGVLLLTNDGLLAQKIDSPRRKTPSKYYVVLSNPLKVEDLQKLKKGVVLDEGKVTFYKINFTGKTRNSVVIEVHGVKNRNIKRAFFALGYKILALDRLTYGNLSKKGLLAGRCRSLTPEELLELQK